MPKTPVNPLSPFKPPSSPISPPTKGKPETIPSPVTTTSSKTCPAIGIPSSNSLKPEPGKVSCDAGAARIIYLKKRINFLFVLVQLNLKANSDLLETREVR